MRESLVDRVWRLPKLIRCHLGISFIHNSFKVPTVTSISLKHLSIEHFNIRFSQLTQLINCTPCIQHLHISINLSSIDADLSLTMPLITSLVLYVHDAPLAFRKILKYVPNLVHLTVKSSDTYLGFVRNFMAHGFSEDMSYQYSFLKYQMPVYMDGRRWEEIIVNHLPKLKTFQLRMDIQCWSRCNKEEEFDKLLVSFSSHFWIRERQWFVRYDLASPGHIYLYTLPYAFDDFNTRHVSIRSKSTSPSEDDYELYNHVCNMYDLYPLSTNSRQR